MCVWAPFLADTYIQWPLFEMMSPNVMNPSSRAPHVVPLATAQALGRIARDGAHDPDGSPPAVTIVGIIPPSHAESDNGAAYTTRMVTSELRATLRKRDVECMIEEDEHLPPVKRCRPPTSVEIDARQAEVSASAHLSSTGSIMLAPRFDDNCRRMGLWLQVQAPATGADDDAVRSLIYRISPNVIWLSDQFNPPLLSAIEERVLFADSLAPTPQLGRAEDEASKSLILFVDDCDPSHRSASTKLRQLWELMRADVEGRKAIAVSRRPNLSAEPGRQHAHSLSHPPHFRSWSGAFRVVR